MLCSLLPRERGAQRAVFVLAAAFQWANTRNRLPSCSSRPGHGAAGEEESEGESAQWVGLALRLAGGWSVACFHFVLFLKGFKTRLLNGILSALPLPSLLSHTHHRNGCHRVNV